MPSPKLSCGATSVAPILASKLEISDVPVCQQLDSPLSVVKVSSNPADVQAEVAPAGTVAAAWTAPARPMRTMIAARKLRDKRWGWSLLLER